MTADLEIREGLLSNWSQFKGCMGMTNVHYLFFSQVPQCNFRTIGKSWYMVAVDHGKVTVRSKVNCQ